MVNLHKGAAWTPQHIRAVVLLSLMAFNGLLIGLHVARAVLNDTAYQGFLLESRWSLNYDQGYAELFQYLLTALTVALLLRLYTSHRVLTYLGWTLTFLFILADDALSLHERFTLFYASVVGQVDALGIETRVYAAAILWSGVGLLLTSLLVRGYFRDQDSRPFSRSLSLLLLGLFFFGGIVDALHLLAGIADVNRFVKFFLTLLEDGGELVMTSLMFVCVLTHFMSRKPVTGTR